MKKEDFRYEYPEKYLEEVYVYDCDDFLLAISNDIFDEDTVQYANNVVDKYIKNKDEMLTTMLNLGLHDFYKGLLNYTDEFIKEKIGKPQISILFKNDGNENWKFDYAGVIRFLEHDLDEHIIEIEFTDDLILDDSINIDG